MDSSTHTAITGSMRLALAGLMLIIALGGANLPGQQAAEEFTPEAITLAPEVLQIFDRSCAECHDENLRRPKGDFGFVLDLQRLRLDPNYVVPGDAAASNIYLLIIEPDDDFKMPPPEAAQPPLTPEEAEKVKAWIDGGAPAPPPAPAEIALNAAEPAPPADDAVPLSFFLVIARLHPLLVHFPIALLLFGVLAEVGRQFRPQAHYEVIVVWSLFLGTLGAIFSAGTGWINADLSGYTETSVVVHRWSGISIAILGALAWGMQLRLLRGDSLRNRCIFWALLLLIAIAVTIAGHTGGELVYGEDYLLSLLNAPSSNPFALAKT